MTQYPLSIYQPDGPPPGPEILDRVGKDRHELNEQIKAAGSWVFTGGLHSPDSATVVRQRGGDVIMTDGPVCHAAQPQVTNLPMPWELAEDFVLHEDF